MGAGSWSSQIPLVGSVLAGVSRWLWGGVRRASGVGLRYRLTGGGKRERRPTKKPMLGEHGLVEEVGSDLLSHLWGSIIGAEGLNYSVRNGKRWDPLAIATNKSCRRKAV